jgi:transposase
MPWLLIEMCAWSLVTDASAGVPQGLLEQTAPRRLEMRVTTRTTAWAGIDIGKTHHWICAVDGDGRALVSIKVANVQADLVAALATVTDLADQVVWAVDIVGAPSAHRRR